LHDLRQVLAVRQEQLAEKRACLGSDPTRDGMNAVASMAMSRSTMVKTAPSRTTPAAADPYSVRERRGQVPAGTAASREHILGKGVEFRKCNAVEKHPIEPVSANFWMAQINGGCTQHLGFINRDAAGVIISPKEIESPMDPITGGLLAFLWVEGVHV
jgi:hypothetical protein